MAGSNGIPASTCTIGRDDQPRICNRPAQLKVRASFDILHEDEHDHRAQQAGRAALDSIQSRGSAACEDTVLRRVREYMAFKRGHKTYVGMLHRLDRDTSGSLAVALSKDAHAAGRELFKHHRFERHYLALVQGIPDPPKRHHRSAHLVRLSRRPAQAGGR